VLALNCLFISVLPIVEDLLIKKKTDNVCIPLTGLTPTHLCA